MGVLGSTLTLERANGVATEAKLARPFAAGVSRLVVLIVNELVESPNAELGVIRPLKEGVSRPLRVDATDEGRLAPPRPTVGADNLVVATKTPHFGGQEK